jgi:hypothetical protein
MLAAAVGVVTEQVMLEAQADKVVAGLAQRAVITITP